MSWAKYQEVKESLHLSYVLRMELEGRIMIYQVQWLCKLLNENEKTYAPKQNQSFKPLSTDHSHILQSRTAGANTDSLEAENRLQTLPIVSSKCTSSSDQQYCWGCILLFTRVICPVSFSFCASPISPYHSSSSSTSVKSARHTKCFALSFERSIPKQNRRGCSHRELLTLVSWIHMQCPE